MIMSLLETLTKTFCFHKKIIMKGSVYDGDIKEPGEESRKVKLAMVSFYCEKCDRIFKINPMGIVEEPLKGIKKEFKCMSKQVPENVRKELLHLT